MRILLVDRVADPASLKKHYIIQGGCNIGITASFVWRGTYRCTTMKYHVVIYKGSDRPGEQPRHTSGIFPCRSSLFDFSTLHAYFTSTWVMSRSSWWWRPGIPQCHSPSPIQPHRIICSDHERMHVFRGRSGWGCDHGWEYAACMWYRCLHSDDAWDWI